MTSGTDVAQQINHAASWFGTGGIIWAMRSHNSLYDPLSGKPKMGEYRAEHIPEGDTLLFLYQTWATWYQLDGAPKSIADERG